MDDIGKNELLLFLTAVLLVGAFIELSYGSIILGAVFLLLTFLSLALLIKIDKNFENKKNNWVKVIIGSLIIVSDITYNVYISGEIQTFDSMIILFGISVIASGLRYEKINELGRFTTYFSGFFLTFYILLFVIPTKSGVDLPYYYGHYFVSVPVVGILQSLGFDVMIPSMRIIQVGGIEPATLKIDLACFGWYSILLIVSMLLSYSIVIEELKSRSLAKIMVVMVFASYLANLLRVMILVVITYYHGLDAMLIVHSHIGWILFGMILIPLSFLIINLEKRKLAKPELQKL